MPIANRKLFDTYKKSLVERIDREKNSSREQDPRIISFKPDHSYRFRLLYYLDDKAERKSPFIEKWVHSFWDEDTKTATFVTCPTSSYIRGNFGFKHCPICTKTSQFWQEHENGSASSHELYKTFKRKFYGFALVYVINDPSTPDNNGHVKIMRFGGEINKFLQKEIFGTQTEEEAKKNVEEPIGQAAFDLESGYDLIVEVGKRVTGDRTYNSYTPKFAREKTSVNINPETLDKEMKEMNFDADYYTKSTKEELINFVNNFIIDSADETAQVDVPATQPTQAKTALQPSVPKTEAKVEVKAEVKAEPKNEVKAETKVETKAPMTSSEIDDIINNIDNIV